MVVVVERVLILGGRISEMKEPVVGGIGQWQRVAMKCRPNGLLKNQSRSSTAGQRNLIGRSPSSSVLPFVFFFGFSISSDCRIEYQILVIRPSFTEKKLGNDRRDIKRPASVFFFFLRAAYVVMVVGFNGPRPAPVMALAKDETHLKKEKRKRNKRRTPSRGRVVPPSRWKK